MELLLILAVAVMWVVVLLPEHLRRRAERANDSISSFNRHLSTLARSNARTRLGGRGGARPSLPGLPPIHVGAGTNRGPVAPLSTGRPVPAQRAVAAPQAARPAGRRPAQVSGAPRPGSVQRRRQDVMVSLAVASLISFLASVTFSGFFVVVTVVLLSALALYVGAVFYLTRSKSAPQRSLSGVSMSYLNDRAPAPVYNLTTTRRTGTR